MAPRIDPAQVFWAAAEPVVRRWIARELSPLTRVRQFAGDAEAAIRNIARMTQPAAVVAAEPERPSSALLWFALGALASGAAFLAGMLLG